MFLPAFLFYTLYPRYQDWARRQEALEDRAIAKLKEKKTKKAGPPPAPKPRIKAKQIEEIEIEEITYDEATLDRLMRK